MSFLDFMLNTYEGEKEGESANEEENGGTGNEPTSSGKCRG
jgi:hypothetical protein